jgi:hypothetical protein
MTNLSQADLTNFTTATSSELSSITGINTSSILTAALSQARQDLHLKEYYTVYLWNYCAWTGADKYSFCSPKQAEFWFNPVEVWGLNNTGVENVFPKQLQHGLNIYHDVSKWMFIVYVIALIATVLEILVGISAIFSRWGSFATTFFSTVRPPTSSKTLYLPANSVHRCPLSSSSRPP